ncbi:MAG: hypothetical protein WCS94_16765 [Verrucomicrobiota bacterium]
MAVSIIKRGLASVAGIVGTIDLVVYPVAQSGSSTQHWEDETVKDNLGFDAAWLARNLHYLADFKFKMLGDTAAHAKSVTFIAPLATVTLAGFDLADINGTYQNMSGAQIDLSNTSVADFATKFRKYGDATQNTASQTQPA